MLLSNHPTFDLTDPTWTVSPESIESKAAELKKVLTDNFKGNTTVVYQLLDSRIYTGRTREKSDCAQKIDGTYHIVGKLEILQEFELQQTVNKIIPLIRAGGNNRKIIISPLQRYVAAPCCPDPDHITNFGSRTYATEIVAGLTAVRDRIRSTCHNKRINNYKVASPEKLLGWEDGVNHESLRVY